MPPQELQGRNLIPKEYLIIIRFKFDKWFLGYWKAHQACAALMLALDPGKRPNDNTNDARAPFFVSKRVSQRC